ncbi:MAG: hypothetical protein HPY83_10265 [Anaerolineae bacterium]|nr:hypothetical protein [Anaerolineae bacterium]
MTVARPRWHLWLALTLALALLLAQPQAVLAASVRLTTDPLTIDVRSFKISPDGRYVVYETLELNSPGEWSLYSVPLSGGPQVQLVSHFGPYAGEPQFHITPDSNRVIYGLPDPQASYRVSFWSVPIAGPATAAVSFGPADRDPYSFGPWYDITEDGSIMVYSASGTLYSAPVSGPAESRKALSMPGEPVPFFLLTPSGDKVVYATSGTSKGPRLYAVPAAGPAEAATLLSELPSGASVSNPKVTSDGRYLVLTMSTGADMDRHLYSLELSLPPGEVIEPVKLNAAGPLGDWVVLSPTGDRVVFTVNGPQNTWSLHSVHPGGPASASVPISLPRPPYSTGFCLEITPDGQTVVYCTRTSTEPRLYPYSVPIDGPPEAAVRLGAPIENDLYFELQLTPDGRRVLYEVDASLSEALVHRLYSAPVGGPSWDYVILSEQLNVWGTPYWAVQISSDGRQALLPDLRDPALRGELYVVPVEGPAEAAVRVNGDLEPGTGVGHHAFAPDDGRVVYVARHLGDTYYNLYVADDGRARVGFAGHEVHVAENARTLRIPVYLSQPSVLPVTVHVVVEWGGDIPGEGLGVDYTLESDAVTIAPGETVGFVILNLVDDGTPEVIETALLALSSPDNATLSSLSRIAIHIADRHTYLPVAWR